MAFGLICSCSALVFFFINRPGAEIDQLPQILGEVRVLESQSKDGFREGCWFVAYELSEEVASKIQISGLSFLGPDSNPRVANTKSNPYGEWTKLPVPADTPALGALTCSSVDGDIYPENSIQSSISQGIKSGDGFFTRSKNREGLILVLPKLKLAAFLYFG